MQEKLPDDYLVSKLFGEDLNHPLVNTVLPSTKLTVAHYLVYGWHPGGFVSAVLAADLNRAIFACDSHNKANFVDVARWIYFAVEKVNHLALGSYESIDAWCKADNTTRIALRDRLEKSHTWDAISNPAPATNTIPF